MLSGNSYEIKHVGSSKIKFFALSRLSTPRFLLCLLARVQFLFNAFLLLFLSNLKVPKFMTRCKQLYTLVYKEKIGQLRKQAWIYLQCIFQD